MKKIEIKDLGQWDDLRSNPPDPGYMVLLLSERAAVQGGFPFPGVIPPDGNRNKITIPKRHSQS